MAKFLLWWATYGKPFSEMLQAVGVLGALAGVFITLGQLDQASQATAVNVGVTFDDRLNSSDEANAIDAAASGLPILKYNNGSASVWTVEKVINDFDAVSHMYDEGAIDKPLVDDLYCTNLITFHRSCEIQHFVATAQAKTKSNKLWDGFNKLANSCEIWDASPAVSCPASAR